MNQKLQDIVAELRRTLQNCMSLVMATPTHKVRNPKQPPQHWPDVDAIAPETYVNAAWVCAHVALWGNDIFSAAEVSRIKWQIHGHIIDEHDSYAAYIAFCERVLLARQYITGRPGRYAPAPSAWLDAHNQHGFNGTLRWHIQLAQRRKANPLHRLEWKALAEAILEITENPAAEHYEYWCIYFSERNQTQALALFRQSVAEAIAANTAAAISGKPFKSNTRP